MFPYFILLFLVLIFAFFGAQTKKNIFLIFISIILTFFSGFRYNVGVDYPNYVKIFQAEIGYGARELGFLYLLDFIRFIDGTYQLMFLILAVIMNVLVYKIIKYYSPNVWISCLIYLCVAPFYFSTFNGTRQYVAIAIFLYSLRFIDQKQLKKYAWLNLIGVFMFHGSLLFIAPLFPLIRRELSLKLKFVIAGIAVLLNSVIELLLSYTPYLYYFNIEKEVGVSAITYLLVILLFPIIIFDKKLYQFKHKTVLINLIFFCFLTLLLVFIQKKDILVQMFMRVNSYFFFIFIVFIPAVVESLKNKGNRLVIYTSLIVCLIAYFVTAIVFKGESSALVPYKMNFKLFN